MTQQLVARVMQLGGDVCGSSAFFEKHPLERFYRDMEVHCMHSRQVIASQAVGAAELGEQYDTERQR